MSGPNKWKRDYLILVVVAFVLLVILVIAFPHLYAPVPMPQ